MTAQFGTETLGPIVSALEFAAHKHRDQRRKDVEASPYINHPIALANVLVNEAGITDVHTICAALLHDTVEDTDTTPTELESRFGARICAIVDEVTDDNSLDKPGRKRQQVVRAATLSIEAKRVKFADKICNLRDIAARPPAGWNLERRQQYFDWAKEVIDRMRGSQLRLERIFDAAYQQRPRV
jgi:guanosine-3',5'-bis(diphosphate) 3'-pyrophosphohydrolase